MREQTTARLQLRERFRIVADVAPVQATTSPSTSDKPRYIVLKRDGVQIHNLAIMLSSISFVEHLEAAAGAAAAKEWPRALDHLIAAWHVEKVAEIADCVAAIDREMRPQPIERRSPSECEAAWHALSSDPGECVVPILLVTPWPRSAKATLARIASLARRPPSPRISRALVSLYERFESRGASVARLSRAIFRLLIRQNDPIATRALLTVQNADDLYARRSRQDLASILKRRLPTAPIPSERARAALDRITVEDPGRLASHTRLYAEVYASPLEDGPREVLADALVEIGDPRGEFIHLQLRSERNQSNRTLDARSSALLRSGGRPWFGGIDLDGATHVGVRRGFPYSARTSAANFTAPGWATIEELEIDGRCNFIGAPTLVGLRSLYGLFSAELARVQLPRPFQLEDIAVVGHDGLDGDSPFEPTMIGLDEIDPAELPRIAKALATWPIGKSVAMLHTSSTAFALGTAVRVIDTASQLKAVGLTGSPSRLMESRNVWAGALTRSHLLLWFRGAHPEETVAQLVDALVDVQPAVTTLQLTTPSLKVGREKVRGELERLAAHWKVRLEISIDVPDPVSGSHEND